MADLIYDEIHLFTICLLLGGMLTLLYDGFRIFRILFQHRNWMIDIEDLMYWIFTAWMVFRTLFDYNQGILRGYAFLGMFLGALIYFLTISRTLLRMVKYVLPHWNKLKLHVKKPITYVIQKFRKMLKNMVVEVKMAIKGR